MLSAIVAFVVLPGTRPVLANPSPSDLSQQLAAASEQLDVIVEQFDGARERLAATQARRAAVTRALVPLQQAVAGLQNQISAYAAGLYENAGGSSLTTLLASGSPESLLDQLTMLDHLAAVHREQIAALTRAQQRYLDQQRDLDTVIAAQNAQQADLAAKRTKIESQIATLRQMRMALANGMALTTPQDSYVPPYAAGPAGMALRFAIGQLGKGYQWGAAGPNAYDCSGLTMAAWRTSGVSLPHSAALQWLVVAHIARAQLRPGDLVFYYSDIHHVAMYAGDNKIIHAPTYGEPVMVAPLDLAPIYGYGRPRY